jgi:hypothetical protein
VELICADDVLHLCALTAWSVYAHVQENLWVDVAEACEYYAWRPLVLLEVAQIALALVVFEALWFLLKRTQWYQKWPFSLLRNVWWSVSYFVVLIKLLMYFEVWTRLLMNEKQLLAGEQDPELVAAGFLAPRAD